MAGLFGGGGGGSAPPPQVIQQPALDPPTPMPVPDPEAQKRAQLRADAIKAAGKTTRQNTIIGNDDSLGGP